MVRGEEVGGEYESLAAAVEAANEAQDSVARIRSAGIVLAVEAARAEGFLGGLALRSDLPDDLREKAKAIAERIAAAL